MAAAPESRTAGAPISLDRLCKRFGGVTAVDSVSLDVRAGEFLSLLGPSGSGKTSLLMMVAGFETPSSGAIAIGGLDVTSVPPDKREIGMVFQRYALFPHMSVRRNVAFPLEMRRCSKAEIACRVDSALAMVQLETLADRMPRQLSGGQQQRVAVARALVFEPPVLLMDEPLGALDRKLREQMQIEIKALHGRLGVTVLYVTHDQEEALTISDRVAVMSAGRIEQLGAPAALYDTPANAFVADFIGRMNFLDGEVCGSDGGATMVRIGGTGVVAASPMSGSPTPVPGARVLLGVRPERLRLAPRGSGGDRALPGTVDTEIFVGSFRIVLVLLGDRERIQVQLPADGDGRSFAPGQPVDVTCDSATVRLYPSAGR